VGNPCTQLGSLSPGLVAAVLEYGGLIRRAGVMAVIVIGGAVRPGESVRAELPARPDQPLERV
jgi:MOSC domain-containing protein YiiM